MTKHVGIYSGTFDPVHSGHIAFALEALETCKLDHVVFLPERLPRGKQRVTPMAHRVALLQAVTASLPGLSVKDLSAEQFTVAETLPELHQLYPDARFTFLMGSDVAAYLPHWHNLDILLGEVSLAIGMRDTHQTVGIIRTIDAIQKSYGLHIDYKIIRTAHAALTSSQIRNAQHDALALNPIITGYIEQHKLYKSS